jgi:hypothetical protein
LADEAGAAKLLLNSWQASRDSHRGVLYWLTGGLEAELMGRNTEAPSSETSPEHDLSGAGQSLSAIPVEAPSNPIRVAPTQAGESMEWTTPDSPTRWAKVFDVSPTTFKRWLEGNRIRHKKLSSKSYQIAIADLPAMHQATFRTVEKPSRK